MAQWYNNINRELFSTPPWQGWISKEKIAEYKAMGWEEVEDTFTPPKDLSQVQQEKWSEIKTNRENATLLPITYLTKQFDFDQKAQKNLSDAIQAAIAAKSLSIPFPTITWTLADNSTLDLAQDQLIAFPLVAGLTRVNSIYNYARILRDQIFSEEATEESVLIISWDYSDPISK